MTKHQSEPNRDAVDVHNRLDKVVIGVTQRDARSASISLTPADARQLAESLRTAADAAERTPSS